MTTATTATTTAQAVAEKVREIAAQKVAEIDPKDGWDEAARRYAFSKMLAFAVTSGTVVVGTPTEEAPRWLSKSARRVWPETCSMAATAAIDLATEALGMEPDGLIVADEPHAVLFQMPR